MHGETLKYRPFSLLETQRNYPHRLVSDLSQSRPAMGKTGCCFPTRS